MLIRLTTLLLAFSSGIFFVLSLNHYDWGFGLAVGFFYLALALTFWDDCRRESQV